MTEYCRVYAARNSLGIVNWVYLNHKCSIQNSRNENKQAKCFYWYSLLNPFVHSSSYEEKKMHELFIGLCNCCLLSACLCSYVCLLHTNAASWGFVALKKQTVQIFGYMHADVCLLGYFSKTLAKPRHHTRKRQRCTFCRKTRKLHWPPFFWSRLTWIPIYPNVGRRWCTLILYVEWLSRNLGNGILTSHIWSVPFRKSRMRTKRD